MTGTQSCIKCGGSGPFSPHKSACRKCRAEAQRIYAAANRHMWKNWALANAEKLKARDAARYAADPEGEKARVTAYRKANPELAKLWASRGNLAKYGITPEDRQAFFDRQGGICPICLDVLKAGRKGMQVDHDHTRGRVRGLLCQPCNILLGDFREVAQYFRAAVVYLQKGPLKDLPEVACPPEALVSRTRVSNLWYSFHMTEGSFQCIWNRQEGVCGICREPLQKGPKTHIDHDHRFERGTGIRGLLCRSCNLGLGHARETPRILLAAADYCVSHSSYEAVPLREPLDSSGQHTIPVIRVPEAGSPGDLALEDSG